MKATIEHIYGTLRLLIDGEIIAPDAYITYFTRNNRYKNFSDLGYTLFSLPVFFSSKTLNEISQAPCFGKAVFDNETPDWDVLDSDFRKIIEACPNALIFPRMNVSLNEAWELANPDELCDTGRAAIHRPCFSSDAWAKESMRLYGMAIDHISSSDYADHVIGYQFAAGNTEEWFSHDQQGSIGKRSREKFAEWCKLHSLPNTEENHYAFLSDIVATRICDLAAFTKKRAGQDKLVGTFYGYTFECADRTSCHHSLDRVLDCPDIDFLCSPVSYANDRALGRDHSCMLPCDSLRLHGKLYFSENDTRTHLTFPPFPELPYFQQPVFAPKKFEDTVEMLKLHYSRSMIHGYAHWWFDMWGGWYDDDTYTAEMKQFLEISKQAINKPLGSVSELAVFIDEKALKFNNTQEPAQFVYQIRDTLGKIGTPYDCYLASDYESVKQRYKAIIIIDTYRTALVDNIIEDATRQDIGCLVIGLHNQSITTAEIRDFCRAKDVHLYSCKDAVIFANQSYLFVHTCSEGELDIVMPDSKQLVGIMGADTAFGVFPAKYGCLFEIK